MLLDRRTILHCSFNLSQFGGHRVVTTIVGISCTVYSIGACLSSCGNRAYNHISCEHSFPSLDHRAPVAQNELLSEDSWRSSDNA